MVIPTYNWATVLPWSIGSVQAQTMTDWELWVIGDGCTDESDAAVRSIRDPRIRWHNLAENGRSQVGPNNLGLQWAEGEYVAYLGHDDLWLPDHLNLLCNALDAGPSMAFGNQLRVDPGRAPYVYPEGTYTYQHNFWIGPTAMMHRRADAIEVGGWRFPGPDDRHDAEALLWGRMAARFGPPVLVPEVTSVKMPAALRQGIYRERPCDEQRNWWARICAAPDGASFVADALADPAHRPPERYDIATVPDVFTKGLGTAAERHRAARRHKGLDD